MSPIMTDGPVGIFDSGVGGLTIVEKVLSESRRRQVIYLGDTARVPYGIKSAGTVERFAVQDVEFLLRFSPAVIVIACHTVSAVASGFLRKTFPAVKFVDVFGPSVRAACEATKNGKVGVIGTPATVKSKRYEEEITGRAKGIAVYSRACPLFVPLVEEGWFAGDVAREVAGAYLEEVRDQGIDTLVLGCTHYPYLRRVIQDAVGDDVVLVDPAEEIMKEMGSFLSDGTGVSGGETLLYFTDIGPTLREMMNVFLPGMKCEIRRAEMADSVEETNVRTAGTG